MVENWVLSYLDSQPFSSWREVHPRHLPRMPDGFTPGSPEYGTHRRTDSALASINAM